MLALPFQFEAGIQRVAVNPNDGQIYTTGLTGWDDGVASSYGVLSRVRYKAVKVTLVTGVKMVKGGIQLDFNRELDEFANSDLTKFSVTQHNYRLIQQLRSDHHQCEILPRAEKTVSQVKNNYRERTSVTNHQNT